MAPRKIRRAAPPEAFARDFENMGRQRNEWDEPQPLQPKVPSDWVKGQLLNVRNAGSHYNVTLLGEEFDPRYPDRSIQFTNSFECQNFVSRWYAREAADPRAG